MTWRLINITGPADTVEQYACGPAETPRPDTYGRPDALDWCPPVPDSVSIVGRDEFGPIFSDGVRRDRTPT